MSEAQLSRFCAGVENVEHIRRDADAGWREADCALRRLPLHPLQHCRGRHQPRIRGTMRAEVERLVEEIKQSVGLLRRHL